MLSHMLPLVQPLVTKASASDLALSASPSQFICPGMPLVSRDGLWQGGTYCWSLICC